MLIDKNGNGAIDKKECRKLVKNYARHLGITLKEGWWKNDVLPAFNSMDSDGSGDITMEELYAFLSQHGASVKDLRGAVQSLAAEPEGEGEGEGEEE